MPRRFAYKHTPAAVPAPARDIDRVGRIVVEGRSPGGVVAPVTLDTAKYATPVLASELGRAWAERFAYDAQPSLASIYRHKKGVVDLLEYCGRVGAPAGLSCRALTAGFLDDWQDDTAGRCPPGQSHPAGLNAGIVFALLRRIAATEAGAVAPEALARARKPAAYSSTADTQPLCEFTVSDLRRLVPAAIRGVWDTERRIAAGRGLVAEGEDPRGSGRWTFTNLVWLAARGELTTALVKENVPGLWRCWDDSLRREAPKTAGHNCGGNAGQLVKAAYRHVFPHPLDLVGHLVLITLDTAAWPEGVKDLRVHDARQLSGGVGVDLVKNRLPGSIEKLAADAGTSAGVTRRFRDAGTVLRSLIEVTDAARARCGSEMVFAAGIVNNLWQGVKVGPVAWGHAPTGSYFTQWIVSNGLDRPLARTVRTASGEAVVTLPAITTPWDSRRLRKATLSHYGEHHPEQMSAWRDNTLATFQEHYVAGSVILKTRIGRLARQAATDLAEMVTTRSGFTVVTAEAAAELNNQTSPAARLLRLDAVKLAQLARGELNVDGGIAACADLHASPFAGRGELCRAARLGSCLACPNAILTPEHIPGLQRFDTGVIEEHRRSLDPVAFAQRWAPIRHALRWALGQLGAPAQGHQR
jgi:hypothetical protein